MLYECDRINNLVTDLLNIGKPRAAVFTDNTLDSIIRPLLELLQSKAREKGVSFDYEADPVSVTFASDRDQLIQIVLNLTINAIQMTPPDGRVVLQCSHTDGIVCLEVSDSGPGIAPNDRSRILDPFVSQRPGGIGLGLAVVHDIVRRHHGELAIEDSTLGGARFVIRIPQLRTEQAR